MKIVLLDTKTLGSDLNLDVFREFGDITKYETTSPDNTLTRVENADIVITNKVVISKDIMQQCDKLKLICIAATGMNNVNLQSAKELNIEVKNVAGYSTNSVTQHTFSMLFYLLEQLKYYDSCVQNRSWSKSSLFTDVSKPFFEISGKKWGIIGLGEIGKSVAKIASSFGVNVAYYSTSGNNNSSNYEQLSLEDLLQTCDIVSIHAPLNDNTLNLINSSNLTLMKDKSVLLNLGRGGIVNEVDLAIALDNKNIYAGLDVLTKEPIDDSNPLLNIANKHKLLITPHIAWTSVEARETLLDGIVDNIKGFLNG